MKKILGLVLISALGGMLTLSTYKLFLEPNESFVVITRYPTHISTNK